jgi:hypothetical protein
MVRRVAYGSAAPSSRRGQRDGEQERDEPGHRDQDRHAPAAGRCRGDAQQDAVLEMVAAPAAEPDHGRARCPGADVGRHGPARRSLHTGRRRVCGHRAGSLPVRAQRDFRPAVREHPRRARLPRAAAELPRHVRFGRGVRADAERDCRRPGHGRLAARAELVRRQAGHLRCELPRLRPVGAGHGTSAGACGVYCARGPARLQPYRVPQRHLRPVQLPRLGGPDRSPGKHGRAPGPAAPGLRRTAAAAHAGPDAGHGRSARPARRRRDLVRTVARAPAAQRPILGSAAVRGCPAADHGPDLARRRLAGPVHRAEPGAVPGARRQGRAHPLARRAVDPPGGAGEGGHHGQRKPGLARPLRGPGPFLGACRC